MANNIHAFRKYCSFAITDVKDLKIGKTYYSNIYPNEFVLKEIISWEEKDRREFPFNPLRSSQSLTEKLLWMIVYVPEHNVTLYSYLQDRNIGGSHNINLIFTDERIAKACLCELEMKRN